MTHVFQPFSIEDLELNPFTKIGEEWTLITAGNKNHYNTMTASWGGMGVLWGKNVIFAFIRDSRYTKELIDEGEFFSLSFLNEEYRDAMNYCGEHSGRDEDKWAKSGLTPGFRHGIPYVDEANLVVLCRKMACVPIEASSFLDPNIAKQWYTEPDYHKMYVAEIIEMTAR